MLVDGLDLDLRLVGQRLFLAAVVLLEVAGLAATLSIEHLMRVGTVGGERGLPLLLVAAAAVALRVKGPLRVRTLVYLVARLVHFDHFKNVLLKRCQVVLNYTAIAHICQCNTSNIVFQNQEYI